MSAGYGRVGGCALYCGFLEVEYINTRYTKKKKNVDDAQRQPDFFRPIRPPQRPSLKSNFSTL